MRFLNGPLNIIILPMMKRTMKTKIFNFAMTCIFCSTQYVLWNWLATVQVSLVQVLTYYVIKYLHTFVLHKFSPYMLSIYHYWLLIVNLTVFKETIYFGKSGFWCSFLGLVLIHFNVWYVILYLELSQNCYVNSLNMVGPKFTINYQK